MTNSEWAFDHRGFMSLDRLLQHHESGWANKIPNWQCEVVDVSFDLLDTQELNQRGMRGPDQYLRDPIPRARNYIQELCKRDSAGRMPSSVAGRLSSR